MNNNERNKQVVGKKAVKFIEDGMVVGLGTGSTVYYMLEALGERVEKGLKIKGIPTSIKTEEIAKEFKIPLQDQSQVTNIDLALDGADEVDPNFNLIKGGGGSLLREKIIGSRVKQLIILIDESKRVDTLGNFGLPIEVVPFCWELTKKDIEALGGKAILRKEKEKGKVFVTDNGNYILDYDFGKIKDPKNLHERLKLITGVVETGLFYDMVSKVLIGSAGEVEEIKSTKY